jgi:hypothetical protein
MPSAVRSTSATKSADAVLKSLLPAPSGAAADHSNFTAKKNGRNAHFFGFAGPRVRSELRHPKPSALQSKSFEKTSLS